MKRSVYAALTAAAGALALAACGQPQEEAETAAAGAPAASEQVGGSATFAQVDHERLVNAASEPGQWLTRGGTYYEQHYSPLDQINTDNVSELGLAWWGDYDTNIMQESTPLYIDGVIYVSTAWSKVYAFDARTGEQLWQYNPRVDGAHTRFVCCGLVNRGVAAWQGKIYVGTLDGRMVALNAETGEVVWETQATELGSAESITIGIRVAEGKVLMGVAGGEYNIRGWMAAYDANTGEELWRFYTVPGNPADGFENDAMEMAAETWTTPGWWEVGGGGPVWDSMVYDPTTRLVYFGVGNGIPWNAEFRDPGRGDNLFLSSIVAVNIDDGSYAWHYQQVPWETWDYDANAPIAVADLEIGGEMRHVIMQAPKNGFLYVLDAATGELLSAKPFAQMTWATGIGEDGRPIEVPEARYDVVDEAFNMLPGPAGAHGWHPMAYSPQTGLVYIPTQDMYFVFQQSESFEINPEGFNLGIAFPAPPDYYEQNPDAPSGFTGFLQAIDPLTGEQVWRSDDNGGPTGGVLATAGGLVFGGGGGANTFRAFDAQTGEKLWEMPVQTGVFAGPIAYELDGEQYVAVSAGSTAQGDYFAPAYARLLVFKLGGTAVLPEPAPYTPRELNPPPSEAPAEMIQAGLEHYRAQCSVCHGEDGAVRGANFPDLRRSPLLYTQDGFDAVVLGGARQEQGMASFDSVLDPEDTAAIRAYIIDAANIAKEQQDAMAAPQGAADTLHDDPADGAAENAGAADTLHDDPAQ